MKETAVEWLESQLTDYLRDFHKSEINEAKKMQKEQRLEDYSIGYSNGQVDSNKTAKQYLKETLKSK
jgi:hypothetical protein